MLKSQENKWAIHPKAKALGFLATKIVNCVVGVGVHKIYEEVELEHKKLELKQIEEEERKEYERLKAKFEGEIK